VRVNAIAPSASTRLTLATPGCGSLMAEPERKAVDLFSPATSRRWWAWPWRTEKKVQNDTTGGNGYAYRGGAISALSRLATMFGPYETDDGGLSTTSPVAYSIKQTSLRSRLMFECV